MLGKQLGILMALVLALLPVFSGCTGEGPGLPDQQQEMEEPEKTEEIGILLDYQDRGNIAPVVDDLNAFLESQGVLDEVTRFDDSYLCEDFETITLYRTTRLKGWNLVVAYKKDSGQYQWIDLEDFALYRIVDIRPTRHDPDMICLHMESKLYGGGAYVFLTYPSVVYYSLEQGRMIESFYDKESGTYGTLHPNEHQLFDDIRISDTEAVFTFAYAEGGDERGDGDTGPKVIINTPRRYEYENPTQIAFWNTENHLDASTIQQLRSLEGMGDVQVENMDNALFTGTLLTLVPQEDYQVVGGFLHAGEERMNTFTIRCEQIRYDEPDFTRHLGIALELPQGMEMSGKADLYYNRLATLHLTAPGGEDLTLELSASPVDPASRYYDQEENERLQKYTAVINGRQVDMVVSEFHGAAVVWHCEAVWYEEDYRFTLHMSQEEPYSAKEWEEFATDFIAGCNLRLSSRP